jgi:Tol biopolymer transport system component
LAIAIAGLVGLCALATAPAAALAATAERVSVDSAGAQGDDVSGHVSGDQQEAISADGRFVAFVSFATNLVVGDTNARSDVFVHDRLTGATERVSVDSGGAQANDASRDAVISADGRFVAFSSDASNLVEGDTNGRIDVFVHDRQTGATERVSTSSGGGPADAGSNKPAISADGRFVAFQSGASNLVPTDRNGATDVFVRDRQAGTTERASALGPDPLDIGQVGDSTDPAISADGRFVAFQSFNATLVVGDTNLAADVFVRDLQTGTTERVSVSSSGAQTAVTRGSGDPAISADGQHVAFESDAANLVDGDTNGATDVFVRDRQAGATERVSVGAAGVEAFGNNPSISADGRFVAFQSGASNLVADDTNLLPDIFVRDRQLATTTRVSVDSAGAQADSFSSGATITPDGRFVAFSSAASNLVAGDTNVFDDVFVRDGQGEKPLDDATAPTSTISLSPDAPNGNAGWYVTTVTVSVAGSDGAGGSGVAETRCVLDPPNAPAAFDDLPVGCPFADPGGSVADGDHLVYAASRDAAGNKETPVHARVKVDTIAPQVACNGVPTFAVGGQGGSITATVTDAGSGPLVTPVSATVTAADVATIGRKLASLTGADVAGNRTKATCAYDVVGASAGAKIVALIDKTLAFIGRPALAAPFKAQLQAVADSLVQRNTRVACGGMDLYIAAVRRATAAVLSAAQKADLIADANTVKRTIGCP